MPGVKNNGDSLEKLIRIFRKQVEKAGVLSDYKKKAEYEKPSIQKKKKSIAARKRHLKQQRRLGSVD